MKKHILSILSIISILSIWSCNDQSPQFVAVDNGIKLENSSIRPINQSVQLRWLKERLEYRKLAEQYLLMRKGLSSTGVVIILYNYNNLEIPGFSSRGDSIYLVIQNDYSNDQMYWQYLLNAKNELSYKLFDCNDAGPQIESMKQR